MKYGIPTRKSSCMLVAPRAGAWIEMRKGIGRLNIMIVAPRAGAWIEIR